MSPTCQMKSSVQTSTPPLQGKCDPFPNTSNNSILLREAASWKLQQYFSPENKQQHQAPNIDASVDASQKSVETERRISIPCSFPPRFFVVKVSMLFSSFHFSKVARLSWADHFLREGRVWCNLVTCGQRKLLSLKSKSAFD